MPKTKSNEPKDQDDEVQDEMNDTEDEQAPPRQQGKVDEQVERHEVTSMLSEIRKEISTLGQSTTSRFDAIELALKDPAKKGGSDGIQKKDAEAGDGQRKEVEPEPEAKPKRRWRLWRTF